MRMDEAKIPPWLHSNDAGYMLTKNEHTALLDSDGYLVVFPTAKGAATLAQSLGGEWRVNAFIVA